MHGLGHHPQIAGIAGDMLTSGHGSMLKKLKNVLAWELAGTNTKTGILQSAKMRYISYKTHTRD